MTRKNPVLNHGYFGIGIHNGKNTENLGTLWRSANLLGANFIFTIGNRYHKQPSDTTNAIKRIPFYVYDTFVQFYTNMPRDCILIGIELNEKSKNIMKFSHPERAIYLLGAEDNGLPKSIIEKCHQLIMLDMKNSLNVATMGSIVIYDRLLKQSQINNNLEINNNEQ